MSLPENSTATREATATRVALVTCAELPSLPEDDRPLVEQLRAGGIIAEPAVWDDPTVDWAGYHLAVLRSTWDYLARREEFVAWAATVPRLANPAQLVAWNTDKRYLVELDMVGVPVIPTSWFAPDDYWQPPVTGQWVVKPAVGAGSRDCGRYQLSDPEHRRLAVAHVARLQRADRLVMVQPYLPAVDGYGETALIFFADPDKGHLTYSHAIRKGPMLTGPDHPDDDLHRPEVITARVPSAAELAVARRAVAAIPAQPSRLLYARVDLIPGPDGRPLLVELELTEPSLFLSTDTGAARRLSAAIVASAAARAVAGDRFVDQ
ncbi:hypothetical protein JQS43_14705 [Natronosporangium hydrolyticum]|uniref:ATP-grasp domain-containing protein n=1 Tax=Natronosporangium hydrolyticum TaxID=2811111 RepID=A0A895Y6C8_9ACTN|nr:hypothetical protein [Natronosporangium hydrolyticum]QSB12921.1 hypothetical protein JQS43_14705 [Natronosporangium hydrolyticum]